MAQTPTSKSATVNNAAKDDIVGHDGDFAFIINDLLANDSGGAAKVDVTKQFFFGTAADFVGGKIPSIAQQVDYLKSHGITATLNDAKDAFVSFSIDADSEGAATGFEYMVQMGNKGTWSAAHVGIEDRPIEVDPVDPHHNGALKAEWTFENHTQAGGDNVGTPNGFWNLNQWAAQNPGAYGADADAFGFSTDIQVHGVDGHRALDTAASPGNIFLQAIPEGRGGALGSGATMPDLIAGKEYHAEVMIAKQHFTDPALIADGHEGTDPDAWVAFQFNNTTLEVHAKDIKVDNEFVKFDAVFTGIQGEDGFTIMSHGTHDDPQGLLIDSIQIYDWLV